MKGDSTWSAFIRRARTPELPVVLLEDAGAMLGLVFALVGVTLAGVTGNPVWDGIGTLAIGILLVGALSATAGIERIIDLRTQHFGPDELLVAGKVEIDGGLRVDADADVIDVAETAMRAAVATARMICLEPDVYDADHLGTRDLRPDDGGAH